MMDRPLTRAERDKLLLENKRDYCPRCGKKVQQHSQTWWCLSCGWARNKDGS